MEEIPEAPRVFLSRDDIVRAMRIVAGLAGPRRHAIVGGVAMSLLGSPRMTADLDLIGEEPLPAPVIRPLGFGGQRYRLDESIEVDWIVRADEYRALYAEALERAVLRPEGWRVATPEHLAAMKLAARRGKDHDDLVTLVQLDVLDLERARDVIRRHVGGRFAVDEFDSIVEEARWRRREEDGR